jgi:UDP-N-acetyl-D-glucosamine dehydrogenase
LNLKETLQSINEKNSNIEVFGLGYIGFPIAVRLAKAGFKITGIDKDENKIQRLERNFLIDNELNLKQEYEQVRGQNKFNLSGQTQSTQNPKISIICVPTPIPSGSQDSNFFIKEVVHSILSTANKGDMIIVESSIEVGTTEWIQEQIELKGFLVGKNYGLAFCPERIDPLNKSWTIHNIPRVIYCSDDITFEIAKNIYKYVNNANLVKVASSRVAEVVKSFENGFRLVNISLVNELAMLCDKLGISVSEVLKAASTKPFGFLPFYTSAGAGGHCIPKDPIFLLNSSKKFKGSFQTIESALSTNSLIPSYIAGSIDKKLSNLGKAKSGIVWGLTYKENIEDMRDSPGFKLIEELRKLNYNVVGYDPFFDQKLKEVYFAENNISKEFDVLLDLKDNILSEYSCIVVVQHHDIDKKRLEEIYQKSLVAVIYDCLNKLTPNPDSKTFLLGFGNNKG